MKIKLLPSVNWSSIFGFFLISLLWISAIHPTQGHSDVQIQKDWITMPDGVRLSVTLYFPEVRSSTDRTDRFPVIFEYLPYRKDDYHTALDYQQYSYFAKRGYVGARVDIRGTGSSEGDVPFREYSEQELEDGVQIIQWLSQQSWSNGNVGMMGKSWGGFNSLQLAMRQPPALKAVIAMHASDDLFHDDINYIDGMMHFDEFALSMDLQTSLSPSPSFPLDEKTLQSRFDRDPWSLLYLRHQRNSQFWMEESLKKDYSLIKIPVFLIGGFLDGYRDTIPRVLANVHAPVKALIGPWAHDLPSTPAVGPAIEWREDAVKWWDHWLKGKNNGVEKDPQLSVYMRNCYPPGEDVQEVPGFWRNESHWPPTGQTAQNFYLASQHRLVQGLTQDLGQEIPAESVDTLKDVPSSGAEAGLWWGDLTPDQRPVDANSLVYDSEPLQEDLTLLGIPDVIFSASSNASQTRWMARLSDVAPNGSVTLITGGGMNSAQRKSSFEPSLTPIGKRVQFKLPLHFTSWVFPKGHRIRIALGNALWPMIWPSSSSAVNQIILGGETAARLSLPVVPNHLNGQDVSTANLYSAPETDPAPPGIEDFGSWWPGTWKREMDPQTATTRLTWNSEYGTRFPWGVETTHEKIIYEVNNNQSSISSAFGEADTEVKLPDRTLDWKAILSIRSDEHNFYYHLTRQLFEGAKMIRQKEWVETVPRDYQ